MANTPQRVACPACKAGSGEPCIVRKSGKQRIIFHLDRWRVFNGLRSEEMLNLPGKETKNGESRKAAQS